MKARAKIRFLTSSEGGRKDRYPAKEGQFLSTPVVWSGLDKDESWLMVFQFEGEANFGGVVMAKAEFYDVKTAPNYKLKRGFKFTLMEEDLKLAVGEITSILI